MVKVLETIPEHIGLGSKTQFLLCLAKGICILNKIDISNKDLTKFVGRGGTSGVGYQIFKSGGFVLDLGHSFGKNREKSTYLPSSASFEKSISPAMPLLNLKIPANWRILLVQLNVKQGANNKNEVNIFQEFCPIPINEINAISHRILMQLLPALKNSNLQNFAQALWFINNNGFKKIEISLQHNYVRKIIEFLYNKYKLPVGMSSFGPTIFLIANSQKKIIQIQHEIKKKLINDSDSPGGQSVITKPTNSGFKLEYFKKK